MIQAEQTAAYHENTAKEYQQVLEHLRAGTEPEKGSPLLVITSRNYYAGFSTWLSLAFEAIESGKGGFRKLTADEAAVAINSYIDDARKAAARARITADELRSAGDQVVCISWHQGERNAVNALRAFKLDGTIDTVELVPATRKGA